MAGKTSDLGQQTSLQAALNGQLKETLEYFEQIESSLSKQVGMMKNLNDSMSKGYSNASKSAQGLADAEKAVSEGAEKATKSQQDFSTAIKTGKKEVEDYQKSLDSAAKMGAAFGDSLTSAASGTLGLVKASANLIGTLVNVGMSIASIPFKLWDAFIEKSMNMPYNPAFRQAMEDVRKVFGDLASGTGKQVMTRYYDLRQNMDQLVKSGISFRQIFGYGFEGRAKALEFMRESSAALGSQFGEMAESMIKHGTELLLSQKGMGHSAEEAAKAMLFFKNSGQDATKMYIELGATAAALSKQTGFNIKTLSKAMVETIEAFPQFSKGGVTAMAKVADYTHRLGIQVKDLQGVFDKFDSFDQAAEAASHLSQAFGVNIDAMKMVKEQDPTKRLESLRTAFRAAGKDINSMTTAERKLAEQTVGLSGAAFEAAMGEGNKKKALSESEKASLAATKAAKDQVKAMKELAKAIERVVPPQFQKFKGFFDAFEQGFSRGLFWSKNFGGMMISLQSVFREVYFFGMRFAQMLDRTFPGLQKFADGFKKIFNPGTFSKMLGEILGTFETFFKKSQTDPKAGFQTLVDNLKNIFKSFFGGEGADSALSLIKEGATKMLSVLGTVLGEGVKLLMQMMTEGIKNITDLILHPEQASGALSSAGGVASSLFGPLLDAIKESGPALVGALKDLWSAAWPKIQPYVEEAGWMLAKFFAIKFALTFGLTVAAEFAKNKIKDMLIGGGGISGIATSLTEKLSGSIGMGIMKMQSSNSPLMRKAGGLLEKIMEKVAGLGRIGKIADAAALGVTIAKGLYDGIQTGMNSNKQGPAAFWDGFQAMRASILSTFTGGLLSPDQIKSAVEASDDAFAKYNPVSLFVNGVTGGWLSRKVDEGTKKQKELAEQIANSQRISAEGIKRAMQQGIETTSSLYDNALKEGKLDDAVSYAAQMEAAKSNLQWGTPEFIKEKNRLKLILREKVEKDLADAASKKAEEAKTFIQTQADKQEAEKMAKIEKARNLVEQVKDVGALGKELDVALAGLDKTMRAGDFESKISRFKERISQIYPVIESVAMQIAEARKSASIQLEANNADPMEVLGNALQNSAKLAEGLNKMNEIPAGAANKVTNFVKSMINGVAGLDMSTVVVVADQLTKVSNDIVTAEKSISSTVADAKVMSIAKTFKGGKLDVVHNIPGVQMNVIVQLDAKEIAKSVVNVDVSKDVNKPKRFSVDGRNEDKSIGA